MNPDSTVTARPDASTAGEPSVFETAADSNGESDTLVDTTLIEEISIDGMCGVY